MANHLRNTIRTGISLAILALPLQSQSPDTQSTNYDQPFRPQVHFSPARNWTNDPNGLVFYKGEYHLFFQYNPFGDQWGHMSWGHAVSTDLLHWHQLPVAIPEKDGTMIFTGSVVVDTHITSGLCPQTGCLVAVYTGHTQTPQGIRQTQNIAFSIDNGRTWTPYRNNPILDLNMADFRDPSVTWDPTAHHWVMAVSLPKEHKVRFYSSPDLKQWTQLSDFGPAGDIDGDWECPDLLRIPAANGKGSIWALKVGLNPGALQGGSGEQYFLGDFNGKVFTQSTNPGSHGWTNYGKDDYCAISFNGLPQNQQPILLGWMSNWQYASKLPTSPWRGQMSLPRRLSFLYGDTGLALRQQPIIEPLREGSPLPISSSTTEAQTIQAPFELQLRFDRPATEPFGIRLYSDDQHWTEIAFDPTRKEFYIDRTRSSTNISPDFPTKTAAPLSTNRPYTLTLVVDRSSIEAWAQDGTIAMTSLIYPSSPNVKIQLFPANPPPAKAQLWKLKSIWQNK
jgi:sucrose-6-phosphate hydrolase SacC (GH32 family)